MPLYSNYGSLVCLWPNISCCLDTAVIMINMSLLVTYLYDTNTGSNKRSYETCLKQTL